MSIFLPKMHTINVRKSNRLMTLKSVKLDINKFGARYITDKVKSP